MSKNKRVNKWNGKLTPTNRWYRDPSDPQYFSGKAMQKRVDQDRISEQTRHTKKLNAITKDKVHEALGDRAGEVVEAIKNHISGYDYGLGHPSHVNYKGIRYPSMLKTSDIYSHLAGNKKLYYTANPFANGTQTVCMVTIDLDNPNHVSNSESDVALQAKDRLVSDLKKLGLHPMAQVSSNGNGFHVTFCISFLSNQIHSDIRDRLNQLRSVISSFYESYSCQEICLKGTNYSRIGHQPALYGTLVKLPKINDPEMSYEFLTMISSPVLFSKIISFYSPSITVESTREREQERTNLYSWGDKCKLSPILGKRNGKKSKGKEWGTSAIARMRRAATMFCHQYKRLPQSVEELIQFYESQKLNTGTAKPNREENAEVALEWITKNHNFTPPSEQSLYDKWIKHFESKEYSLERMTYTTGRFIRPYHLALVAAVIEHKQLSKHERGIAKNYFIQISREKKNRGEIGFVLDNKKFAHCISMLVDEQVVEISMPSTMREGTKYRIHCV